MVIQKLYIHTVLCFAILVLSGCAIQEPGFPTNSEPKADFGPLSFSEQVGALPDGAVQYYAESPFGSASIEAGDFYLSGLGNECRSVRVIRGNMSHRFALCKDAKGNWQFIPTVFEAMPQ